jgi:ABC-type multidrug transport system fused ATPase/permease subunit
VWILRACTGHAEIPTWAFVAVLMVYDSSLLRLDLGLNWLFASRVSFPMFGYLRSMSLGKVLGMPQEWHQRQQSGALVGKVNDGVGKVVQTSEALGRELFPALVRTTLSMVPLVYFSPLSIPFITIAVALFAWATAAESRCRQPYRKSRYQNYARDFGIFSECLEYVQPIVHFGQTRRILSDYSALQKTIAAEGIEETRIGAKFGLRRNTLLSIAKRACLGVWIWQFRSGAHPFGNTMDIAMVMYLSMLLEDLFGSLWGYASLFERIQDGIEPASTLLKLLEEESSMPDEGLVMAVPLVETVGIELCGVHFAYGNGTSVLRDFNLAIEPGTILGIVGRSGVGKTTIQNLLSRTYDPQQGQILIAGEDIRSWPLEQLRGIFAPVTQNGGVFFSDTSVLDTIRFARPEATAQEAIAAAQCACIHADIVEMTDGYHTRIAQRGTTLSKGQQQRLALAQALVAMGDRKIVVLDEFTSALDSKTEQELLKNLTPLLKGRTVIIIAHRLSTLRKVADKIIVLGPNGILEVGGHDELVRRGGTYAELASLQATA